MNCRPKPLLTVDGTLTRTMEMEYMSSSRSIDVLMVEDSPDDAYLIELELVKAGYEVHITRVETAEALEASLCEKKWDVLISDYNLPGFDGLSALQIVQEKDVDIPFILVSGTVGEEFAVESVLAGANDYVMKDNLKRVPVAVQREISNKILRDQKRAADEKIRSSLKEKEVMLKEIHHRVKNNMAVISALLTLQADYVNDKRSRQLFHESVGRIKSMALVHEKLYQSELMANVVMDEYLRDLVATIEESYQRDDRRINVQVTADNSSLDITKAIPCGLIVNELLTNAFKHAFTGKETGNIHLILENIAPENRCRIQVKDDGIGIPPDVLDRKRSSLGFTIVQGLAQQIVANMEISTENGSNITLEFDCD